MGEIYGSSNKLNEIWANGYKIKEVWSGNNKVWSGAEPIFVFGNSYDGKVYISQDKCQTFTKTTGQGYGVGIHENTIVTVGVFGRSQVSYDLGSTWSTLSGLNTNAHFYSVCYCPDTNMYYTFGTAGQVYRTDGSSSWQLILTISAASSSSPQYKPKIVYGNNTFMLYGNNKVFNCGSTCTSLDTTFWMGSAYFVDYSGGEFLVGNGYYLLKLRKESDGSYKNADYISTFGSDGGYGYYHLGATYSDGHLISAYNSNYSGATNNVMYDDSGQKINEISSSSIHSVIDYRATIRRVISYGSTIVICGDLNSSYSSSYACTAVSQDYGHTWTQFSNYMCFCDGNTNIVDV